MEYRDEFPNSTLVSEPAPGSISLFHYTAKTALKLPYYDRNPLCYVVAREGRNIFYGINLHYHPPANRESLIRYIDSGSDFTRLRGYHKYLKSYVNSPFLQISMEEWGKAVALDSEQFVRDLGAIEIDISPSTVYRKGFYKD